MRNTDNKIHWDGILAVIVFCIMLALAIIIVDFIGQLLWNE